MTDNPFQAPKANVEDAAQMYGEVRLFGFAGRMGRLRYLSYTFVSSLVIYLGLGMVVGILAAILIPMFAQGGGSTAGEVLFVLVYLAILAAILVVQAQYGVRRLHDLNMNGWLWLIMLVPLVNIIFGLYLLFAPGTDTANNYGPPPPPNTAGVWIGALGVPFAMCAVIGILAAIAIPSYQQYTARAEGMQAQAEFSGLLSNMQASSVSVDETRKLLERLPGEASTQYRHLEMTIAGDSVEVGFRKPKAWSAARFVLRAQAGSDEVLWQCTALGASSQSNDRAYEMARKRCEALQ